jgi:aryl-alcohol dehydrogenase-like predicted oxidoreductase
LRGSNDVAQIRNNKMKYQMKSRPLPNTSLSPSVLCLGTADYGAKISREEAFALLDAFVDAGGTFIDTAEIYNDWVAGEKSRSEKIIGAWLAQRGKRDDLVIATKGAHPRLHSMNVPRMRRKDIEHDLNASLKNLRTNVIDLYWLHRDDPATPVEEIITTLNAQVSAGKIKHFGCSNWHTDRIHAANTFAAKQSVQGFVANQPMWSLAHVPQSALADQTCVVMDEAMRALHVETQLACVPYSSQAGGFFQKMASGAMGASGMYAGEENVQRAQRVQQVAKETGMTISEVVLAYLLSQPFAVFSIVGCRNLSQLRDTLSAHDKRLSPAQLAFLDAKDRMTE